MKSKAPLSLMEQLIMLVVFALAAALCLQVFVLSSRVSRNSETQSSAVTAVQNTTEVVKGCHGDFEDISRQLGGTSVADCWQLGYDENWDPISPDRACYLVNITPVPTDLPTLGSATVSAHSENGTLFSMTVSWQEALYE